MLDALSSILDAQIDYQAIFMVIGIYLASLWVMFCVWVFADARKRYRSWVIAFFFALIVLILNFPALIFYLIVRPELDDWLPGGEVDGVSGGIRMPLVHYMGENGEVQMSLNITMSPKILSQPDMVIGVDWKSEQSHLTEEPVELTAEPAKDKGKFARKDLTKKMLPNFKPNYSGKVAAIMRKSEGGFMSLIKKMKTSENDKKDSPQTSTIMPAVLQLGADEPVKEPKTASKSKKSPARKKAKK